MEPRSQTASVNDLLAHVGWVQALARSLVRDASTADDLAQETWMAALSGTRATNESPRGWLGRVLRNRLIQRGRSETARSDHERQQPPEPDLPSSDDLLERIEQQKLLAEALASLREPFREPVILRYYEGLNATEIGERLGESSGAIRQRLKRGLEALREDLDNRVEGGREAWLSALLPLVEYGRSGSIPLGPVGTGAGSALIGAVTVKKLALLVTALFVAGGAAFWWDSLQPEDSPGSLLDVDLALQTPASDEVGELLAESEPVQTSPVASSDDNRTAVTSTSKAAREASMTGRVSWPDRPAPFDETLEVFALSDALGYEDFVLEDDRGASKYILATTLVNKAGEFSFAFEDEPDVVHVMVRGRHLYLEETVEVALGGTPMVVLTPVCGAWVRGRVSAPQDVTDKDPNALENARVQLLSDRIFGQTSGVPEKYSSRVDSSGHYELRAIVGESGAKLFATADALAAQLVALEDFESCAELSVDIQLQLGGRVRGRAVDDKGFAVSGAVVRAILPGEYLGFDDHRVGEAIADAEGQFALDHLPPGDIFLAAFQNGFLDSEKLSVTIQNREELEGAVLVLPSGNRLSGYARFEDGSAVAGVEISVEFDKAFQVGISAFNALRGAKGSALTSADGAFQITGLGAGPFVVKASYEQGEASYSGRADAAQPNSEVELLLLEPLELKGAVATEAGLPVSDFDVRAVRIVEGAIGATATNRSSESFSTAEGSFVLDDLIAGRWRVDVVAEGYARSEPQTIELPSSESLSFVIGIPAAIQGIVLGPDGDHVADAKVSVETGESKWQAQFADSSSAPSTVTDDRGRFRLTGVRSGEVSLSATATGFAKSPTLALTVGSGAEENGAVLQLTRGGRITGEILEEGKPAPDRVITLVQWQRNAFDTSLAESDANGRFEFNNVEPGLWNVVALDLKADWSSTDKGDSMSQRMASMKSAQVRVREGSEDHVVLGAQPKSPLILSGRVTRGDEPYVGAMVLVSSIEDGPSAEEKTTAVDENGEYSITLDGPGGYQLSVSRMGRASGEISAFSFVYELEDKPEILIDIEIPGGGISGVVTDEAGTPLSNVGVALVPGSEASVAQVFERRFIQTSTDESGRFELPDLGAGNYELSTSPFGEFAGAKLHGVDLGRDQWLREIEIQLKHSGGVDVHVADTLSRVCADAAIFARTSDGAIVDAVSPTRTNADGLARYEGLAPGTYTFFARSREFTSALEVEVTVKSGERSRVDLPVEVGSFLIVTAKEDREIAPASFYVEDEAGRDVSNLFNSPFEAQAHWLEGLSGQRRIGPLPPGAYKVFATASSGSSGSKRVSLQANTERKLTLRL